LKTKSTPESNSRRRQNFILHLHPAKVREASIKFSLTFGLGGMAAVLFLIQVFTGILLRFSYSPTPAEAYDSILSIQNSILFGQLVRNMHHWSGILFVVIAFLHLLRTFYTGAFYPDRRWNWVLGISLMVTVIFANFTGYLLPWDQLAYWAITVSTSMLNYFPVVGDQLTGFIRGGQNVNASTLLIFYNFHTAILPLTIVLLMVFHFWKVRKNNGVVVPENADGEMVPSNPDLVSKELVVALSLIAFVLILSILFNAPLQERADPALSPNPAKAPWYFMGIQELLLHFHPFFGAILIPLLFLTAMIWLPFLRYPKQYRGIWFFNAKGKKLAWLALISATLLVTAGTLLDEYFPDFEIWLKNIPPVISNGLIPFILVSGLIFILTMLVKKKLNPDKSELILFVFSFVIASYALLTIAGVWFRGPGMKLMWP